MSLSPSSSHQVCLRPAVPSDAPLLTLWDSRPHLQQTFSDLSPNDPPPERTPWEEELSGQSDEFQYWIAEVEGRPIGVMLDMEPSLDPNQYWGEIEPFYRALDIWIGEADALNRGYGTQMMRLMLDACFARPEVEAVLLDPLASNQASHRFYQRLGFTPAGRRLFDRDDCLVHRLDREAWRERRKD